MNIKANQIQIPLPFKSEMECLLKNLCIDPIKVERIQTSINSNLIFLLFSFSSEEEAEAVLELYLDDD